MKTRNWLQRTIACSILLWGVAVHAAGERDRLAQAQAKGVLTACIDPYSYLASAQASEPPGYDVEIVKRIAQLAGLKPMVYWADTGTRGSLGKALRDSIVKGRCDFFMGLSDTAEDLGTMGDETGPGVEVEKQHLAFTHPYLGQACVLLVQGSADKIKDIKDLKGTGIKTGVQMATPVDAYFFDNEYPRSLYFRNREIMKALADGEIDAAMLWPPQIAIARKDFPNARFHPAAGFVPERALCFNTAIAAPEGDAKLPAFLDASIGTLLDNREIQQIVERYGVPFFQPFVN